LAVVRASQASASHFMTMNSFKSIQFTPAKVNHFNPKLLNLLRAFHDHFTSILAVVARICAYLPKFLNLLEITIINFASSRSSIHVNHFNFKASQPSASFFTSISHRFRSGRADLL
jgi:hypothetical protein